jgi:hypothetical protein
VEVRHGIQVGQHDEFETCFGVQGHRLPIIGGRMVGHDIATEHGVLPKPRQ